MVTMKPLSVLTRNRQIKLLFSWRRDWVSSLQCLLLVFNNLYYLTLLPLICKFFWVGTAPCEQRSSEMNGIELFNAFLYLNTLVNLVLEWDQD